MPSYNDKRFYKSISCGLTLEFQGPASVFEYDRVAAVPDACLEDAVQQVIVHDTLDVWQDKFIPIVERISGIARGFNKKATEMAKTRSKRPERVRPVPEKFALYMRRVFGYASDEQIQAIRGAALDLSRSIHIDPTRRNRGKEYIPLGVWTQVDYFCNNFPPDFIEDKILKWTEGLPTDFFVEREDDGTPKRDSLARLLVRYRTEVLIGQD